MNALRLAELIDKYLMGTIIPEDKRMLDQLIDTDPQVAEMVKESRQAFSILLSERNRRLKEKLRTIDKNETKRLSLVHRMVLSFTVFLLICFCAWYWCMVHHHPAVIARQYFGKSYLEETRVEEEADVEIIRLRADSSFRKGNYELALQLYHTWKQESKDTAAFEARWNLLLARLALTGPTPTWKKEMGVFLLDAPEPGKSIGQELVIRVDSGICNKIKNFFYSLNPKII